MMIPKPNFEICYNQSTENTDRAENETHVYRNPAFLHELKQFPFSNMQMIMENVFNQNSPEDSCILERKFDSDGNGLDELIRHSYGKVRNDAELFGRGILELQLAPWKQDYKDYNVRFLGIYAPNVYRYIIHEWACVMHKIVSATVYDTKGEKAALFPFENTRFETLCLTVSKLDNLMKLKETGNLNYLKTLIIIDKENLEQGIPEMAEKTGFKIYTWEDIVERGRKSQIKEWTPVKDDDVFLYCFTSGSTGFPKGALYAHKNIAFSVQALQEKYNYTKEDRHLNFFPMAHMFERFFLMMCLNGGTKIHLSNLNPGKLGEDFRFHKPTFIVTSPSQYNQFYNEMKDLIQKKNGTAMGDQILKAIDTKLQNLKKHEMLSHPTFDELYFKELRAVTGGCVRLMVSTTAPLKSQVCNFLKITLSCQMIEIYGQTEAGPTFTADVRDFSLGHIGGVLPHNEFKLVDIPEMGYTSRDIDPKTGLNVPRGEVWIRGYRIIPGYHKNDAKNAESFTEDRWLRTGDVAKIVPPSNKLVIIDRKQSMFKLSSGSFISPEHLEGSYRTCTGLFTDVFIYGDSFKSFLLIVITIEPENLKRVSELVGMDASVKSEELFASAEFEKKGFGDSRIQSQRMQVRSA